VRGLSLALARSALGLNQLAEGGKRASILGSFVFVELLVGGFDEVNGSAAVIWVDAHADADSDGWLALIGAQPVLDALGDLLSIPSPMHAVISPDDAHSGSSRISQTRYFQPYSNREAKPRNAS
jgi:hypothetical protein